MPAPRRKQPRTPRWRRRPAARREEILRAALAIFGRAGYAEARLTDVAREAGISKAALYRYFASKAALFHEMIRAQAGTSLDREDAVAGFFPDSAEKQLRRFVRDSWAALHRSELRSLTRLVSAEQARFPELGRFYWEEVILRLGSRLARVLDAGLARGEFRPAARGIALHALPSILLHQAMLRDGFGDRDPPLLGDDELVAGCVDLVLHGVVRRGTPTAAE